MRSRPRLFLALPLLLLPGCVAYEVRDNLKETNTQLAEVNRRLEAASTRLDRVEARMNTIDHNLDYIANAIHTTDNIIPFVKVKVPEGEKPLPK